MLCRNYCREKKCIELGKGFGVVLAETMLKYLNTKQLYESAEQLCLQIHFKTAPTRQTTLDACMQNLEF